MCGKLEWIIYLSLELLKLRSSHSPEPPTVSPISGSLAVLEVAKDYSFIIRTLY